MLAGLAILKAIAGVVASACKWPHVVECPNNRNRQFAHCTDAGDATIYPVKIDDIGIKTLSEFRQVGALQT
jgi:hypothetical protein